MEFSIEFKCSHCKQTFRNRRLFKWPQCNHRYCPACAQRIMYISLLKLNVIPQCSTSKCKSLLNDISARPLYIRSRGQLTQECKRKITVNVSPIIIINSSHLISGFIRTECKHYLPDCLIPIISDYYQLTSIYELIKCSQCEYSGYKQIPCSKCNGNGIKKTSLCYNCINGSCTIRVACQACGQTGKMHETMDCPKCCNSSKYLKIVTCYRCDGTGIYCKTHDCHKCGGVGAGDAAFSVCVKCDGSGKYTFAASCFGCNGTGNSNINYCNYCDGKTYVILRTYACTRCGGSKKAAKERKCSKCNGSCKIEEKCDFCFGRGFIRQVCSQCNGDGYILLFNLKRLIRKQVLCYCCNEYHLYDNVIRWDINCNHHFCIRCFESYLIKQIIDKKTIPKCSVKECQSKNEVTLEKLRLIEHSHLFHKHKVKLNELSVKLGILISERDRKNKFLCSVCKRWVPNERLYLWTNCDHPYCLTCALKYITHCLSKIPQIPKCIAQNNGCKQLLRRKNIARNNYDDELSEYGDCLRNSQSLQWKQMELRYQQLKLQLNVCVFSSN